MENKLEFTFETRLNSETMLVGRINDSSLILCDKESLRIVFSCWVKSLNLTSKGLKATCYFPGTTNFSYFLPKSMLKEAPAKD